MQIATQLTEIFLLGLIGGAVPGSVLTAVFTEVLSGGLSNSMRVIFKALLSEAIIAVLILGIVSSLRIPQFYFYILSIAGAVFLIWLSSKIWKIEKVDGQGEIFSFAKIFILTILNGAFWIFWLTVCVPRAFALKEQIVGGQFLFLFAFELGWLLMTASLAFIFSRFRPLLLKKNFVSVVFKLFALMLIFFSFKSIIQSVGFLIK